MTARWPVQPLVGPEIVEPRARRASSRRTGHHVGIAYQYQAAVARAQAETLTDMSGEQRQGARSAPLTFLSVPPSPPGPPSPVPGVSGVAREVVVRVF